MNAEPSPPSTNNLALIRTDLANERTLLAYGRTALMVAGTGVTLIKFLGETPGLVALGWVLNVLGITIGIIGIIRFTKLQRRLHA